VTNKSKHLGILVVLALLFMPCLPDCFAASNTPSFKTVVPVEIDDPLVNPYSGWGIWVGPRDWEFKNYSVADNTTAYPDDAPLFNWVMLDWNWSDIEPVEGRFTWDGFDTVFKYWAARKKQFVVRVWVTDDAGWNGDPGTNPIPDWLWAKGLRYHEYKGNGSVTKREPDYADPSYEKVFFPALQKLLSSFGERYDKRDTPIIFLQVMGYGHWADWATWYSKYKFPNRQFKHDVLAKLMGIYIDKFKNFQLFEMAAGDWDQQGVEKTLQDRLYTKALDVALAHNFGLIWTGFIDGLAGWDRDLMQAYWKTNPIIAEDNWDYLEIKEQRTHGTLDENLDLMLDYHATLAHYYVRSKTYARAMKEDRANFERGLKNGGLGYRLLPTSLSWRTELPAGNLMSFKQTWVNRNVGRLCVQHPLRLYLTDAQGVEKFSEVDTSFDERTWVRGESYPFVSVFHLPKDLPAGDYDVRIALVGNDGKPRIRLGIEGLDTSGRYKVGMIHILAPEGTAACDKDFCP